MKKKLREKKLGPERPVCSACFDEQQQKKRQQTKWRHRRCARTALYQPPSQRAATQRKLNDAVTKIDANLNKNLFIYILIYS